jgi:hypothetical protein
MWTVGAATVAAFDGMLFAGEATRLVAVGATATGVTGGWATWATLADGAACIGGAAEGAST